MALKVLEAIQQAEKLADQLVREAQQSAREMIEQAERSCRERERQGELDSRARHLALMEQRKTEVEQHIRRQQNALRAQREAQMAVCREKLPKAADMIVERMLTDGLR